MKNLITILSVCFASGTSLATDKDEQSLSVAQAMNSARRVGNSWDLEVELGVRVAPEFLGLFGWNIGDFKYRPDHWFYSRIRAGYLVLNEPWYLSFGPTVVYGGLGEWSFGIQGVLTNIYDGYWCSFETAWSLKRNLKFSLGSGLGIFGLEWVSTVHPAGHAILLKVRLPIGLIVFAKNNF